MGERLGRWAPEGATPPPGAASMGPTPRGGVGPSGSVFVSSSVPLVANIPKINTGWLVSNLADISLRDFLKPKTAENRELALWHLVNRLVPENA